MKPGGAKRSQLQGLGLRASGPDVRGGVSLGVRGGGLGVLVEAETVDEAPRRGVELDDAGTTKFDADVVAGPRSIPLRKD